jgi:hypothetical protein
MDRAAGIMFLTPREVCERYRGEMAEGALQELAHDENRTVIFLKVGRAVLYPYERRHDGLSSR